MNVTLRQLRVFQSVAQTRNFSRTGEAIGLTQPAVSRAIAELERELGLRLLHVDVPRTDEVADSVMALLLGLLRRTHVLAAQGCGVRAVFAGWGYGPAEMAHGAAAIAPTTGDLPAIAARLRAA